MMVKIYGAGSPDPKHISASFVERQHLSMRLGMRRFTRLTNGFSQKTGEPRPCSCAVFYALQFLSCSQDAACASNGSRSHRSRRTIEELISLLSAVRLAITIVLVIGLVGGVAKSDTFRGEYEQSNQCASATSRRAQAGASASREVGLSDFCAARLSRTKQFDNDTCRRSQRADSLGGRKKAYGEGTTSEMGKSKATITVGGREDERSCEAHFIDCGTPEDRSGATGTMGQGEVETEKSRLIPRRGSS
jgi:hypothetical protein